jgi:hypothetical protein
MDWRKLSSFNETTSQLGSERRFEQDNRESNEQTNARLCNVATASKPNKPFATNVLTAVTIPVIGNTSKKLWM